MGVTVAGLVSHLLLMVLGDRAGYAGQLRSGSAAKRKASNVTISLLPGAALPQLVALSQKEQGVCVTALG